MLSKKNIMTLIFLSFFFSSVTLSYALPFTQTLSTNDSNSANLLALRLFDGDYGDFDSDGREDDIEVFLEISMSEELKRKNLMLELSVYLPNGDSYAYSIMISTVYDTIVLHILFFNHAYVPGDYTVKAEINLFTEGHYYSQTEITFDPPSEEVPDDDPFISFSAG